MHRFSRVALSLSIAGALAIAGCSGSSTVTPSQGTQSRTGQATFRILIPAKSSVQSMRAPKYVSPDTGSVSFSINGASATVVPLGPSAAGCTGSATAGYVCTASLVAPVGRSLVTVKTFASSDGSGDALSQVISLPITVTGSGDAITFTLDGVAKSLALTLSPTGVTNGTAATVTATWTALDAAGDTIIAPGGVVTSSGTALATPTLTSNPTSGFTIPSAPSAGAATGAWSVAYDGSTAPPSVTFTVSAAGVTAGTATLAVSGGSGATASPAPQFPCDIAALEALQALPIPYTSTAPVDACGTVTGGIQSVTSSGTTHLHFDIALDDNDGAMEIVSNENLMGTFTVNVGDYVYVQGQYYHDADGTQGIHDTHCQASSSWPFDGWVIVNGVTAGTETCSPAGGGSAGPTPSPTAAPSALPSASAPPSIVSNVVANGDFEAGALTPWTACSPSTNGHDGAASTAAILATLPDSHSVPQFDGPGAAMIGVLQNGKVGVTGICQQLVVPTPAVGGKVMATMYVWEGGSEKDTTLSDQEADVLSADGSSQLASLFIDSACSVTATEGFKKHCDPTQNGGIPATGGVWVQRGPYDVTAYAGTTVTLFVGIWLGPTASISDFMYVDDVSVAAQ